MAQVPCTSCDSEYAAVMFTNMDNGDTESVGAQCLPGFALSLAASVTSGMPPELAAAYGDQFDQIAANDTRPRRIGAAVADSRRGKAKSVPPAPDSPPDGVSQPLTADDLTPPADAAGE